MMISYDEALQQVIDAVCSLQPIEVSLYEAAGLVLAASATAHWDMPSCDNSAMDGFAIDAGAKANHVAISIVGDSFAGHPYQGEIQTGQAVRITTGAALPLGADTVVPIEDVEEKNGHVYLRAAIKVGNHIRYQGEEYRYNDVLLESGVILRAGEIALLASAGVDRVSVYPRPRVAVISTGDELVELGQVPGPGQIINSNMHLLKTRLTECGCTPVCFGIRNDDPESLGHCMDEALEADIIISTGGVSVGEKDHVQATLEKRNFKKHFWKVAIKPGKPVLFGMLEGKPYFGLPGNPAATAATFELFVRPALRRLAGHLNVLPEKRNAVLTEDVRGGGNRQTFLWCRLEWQENRYNVSVSQRQGSGQNRCLTSANTLLSVPVGVKKLRQGEDVEVFLL
jgi:molybdopterin molybdotransferase